MEDVLAPCIRQLKASGLPITPKRITILKSFLIYQNEPLTANEILIRVQRTFPNISKSTILRNLDILRDKGIVTELKFENKSIKYQLS